LHIKGTSGGDTRRLQKWIRWTHVLYYPQVACHGPHALVKASYEVSTLLAHIQLHACFGIPHMTIAALHHVPIVFEDFYGKQGCIISADVGLCAPVL